ncbi:MAG: DUF2117 domain-containing protein [Candidatus Methanoperedens sp.]|nr:DUF2117 domain-containing protein [Candidatus Methanoperedens sp.]MCE8425486.1 DUF2117 domain-containing protein [Candidatus Methanoperedens sp.]MCE8427948.1 DUF2117 domain-containing protein [Candidatus Methanoperedens sp.]
MRIGIVLHGPEIIDTGSAKRVIEIFKKELDIISILGGTMGRTAVLDAGLENIIDISKGLTPSETINALKGSIDLAILLNHGKTLDTGRHFGRIIASRLDPSMPFVHIERPDLAGRIIYYVSRTKRCAEFVKQFMKKHDENYDLQIEQGNLLPMYVRPDRDLLIRRVSGAFPGENIRLEGVVIGEVINQALEIVCKDGKVIELRGGKIKQHGLEKINERKINIFTARVKTGNIRRTKHEPRIAKIQHKKQGRSVALIDHCAESTFELIKDADLVVTVGDDTTAVAADILTRLGIPIIGITDGDLDRIIEDNMIPEDSVIVRVTPGHDDSVGKEIFEKLMDKQQKIYIIESDEFLARILSLAEKYLEETKYY